MINCEGFMHILAEIWDQWAPEETIINAAERVGISKSGLDVKDSVKAQHTCSRFFKYLKTYAFYPQKGIYFLKGNKILYKIVVYIMFYI